ncbi:hypothetical protein ACE38V_09845 [Cytobacillus sp. Hz8]|uniref:hypothetical protein n=1 Tax=Cytobacillus sp. Hz8 TaxID=3347168 RepID=UPI0035DE7D7F
MLPRYHITRLIEKNNFWILNERISIAEQKHVLIAVINIKTKNASTIEAILKAYGEIRNWNFRGFLVPIEIERKEKDIYLIFQQTGIVSFGRIHFFIQNFFIGYEPIPKHLYPHTIRIDVMGGG